MSSRAEFTWEIENFSTTVDVKLSPTFTFPDNSKVRFRLECSPCNDIKVEGKTVKFVVFNLYLDPSEPFEARALLTKPCVGYRLAILGTNGTEYFSQECQNRFIYPNNTPDGVYGGYLIKRDYLLGEVNFLLNNDKLTVYCEVDDSCIEKILTIPPDPIQDDYRSLLESGEYSDVVLLIGGMALPVHKNILTARSDVFAAMFENDLEVKGTNLVKITDVAFEVMELVLGYIYTGEIPELNDYATELFVAADKYQLKELKTSAQNSFKEDFESLLDNGKFSDAFLVVDYEKLPVHRNILCARSNVFAELFEDQTRVQVNNISVEACKELLLYIYTGQFWTGINGDDSEEFVPQLLEASHKYGLNHLKAICEESLSYSIQIDSVVDKFVLADTNEANHLKRICFEFICENIKQVIQTEGWNTLKQARPEFAFELFEQVAKNKW